MHSCTIKSVEPQAFSAGHMTKRVRQKGRERRLWAAIKGEKKKVRNESNKTPDIWLKEYFERSKGVKEMLREED